VRGKSALSGQGGTQTALKIAPISSPKGREGGGEWYLSRGVTKINSKGLVKTETKRQSLLAGGKAHFRLGTQ